MGQSQWFVYKDENWTLTNGGNHSVVSNVVDILTSNSWSVSDVIFGESIWSLDGTKEKGLNYWVSRVVWVTLNSVEFHEQRIHDQSSSKWIKRWNQSRSEDDWFAWLAHCNGDDIEDKEELTIGSLW